nr:LysR family transcriptional regulator [Agrobacterium burrii]
MRNPPFRFAIPQSGRLCIFARWKDVKDWNEFRIVLAIGRAGSLVGAARDLGHDHSTIFRWLNALEKRRGVKLFDRTMNRYVPTDAGVQMIMAAERLEAEIMTLDRSIAGQDNRLLGKLKITSSETLAYRILNEVLADFRREHDGIELELLVDNRQLDLLRREADVAIRATRPHEGELFGRKIASTPWTFYGSSTYLAERGRPADIASLSSHVVVGWDSAAVAAASMWLTENISPRAFAYRSSSLVNQLMAVKAGLGLALLPCYLGDPEPDIERVQEPLPELTRELWLITHKDLRNTARVRAFFDHVGGGLLARRALLEGKRGGSPSPDEERHDAARSAG